MVTNDRHDQSAAFRPAATEMGSCPSCQLQTGLAKNESVEHTSLAADEWERTFDAVPDLVAILDTEHRIVRVNKAMADRLGVTKNQCVGQTCYSCVHGTDAPPSLCPHSELLQDGQEHTAEVYEERLAGDFLISVSPLFDASGHLTGSVHIARDITDRKQADAALLQSREHFRMLYERSPLGYQSLDDQGRLLDVNLAWLATLGYSREQVIGRWFGEFLSPEYVERFRTRFEEFKAAGETSGVQFEMVRKDGSRIVVEFDGRIGYDADGAFQQTHCTMRDITDRVHAEETARLQHDLTVALNNATRLDETLRLCLQTAIKVSGMDGGGIYLVDETSGELRLVHHAGLSREFVNRVYHYGSDSANARLVMAGRPIYTHLQLRELGKGEALPKCEGLCGLAVVPICHRGEVVACLNVASHAVAEVPSTCRSALETVAGQMGGAIAKARTEQSLRQSQEKLQTLFDTIDDFVFVLDLQGTIIQVNPVVSERLGYEVDELLGESVLKVHPPERHAEATAILAEIVAGRSELCPIPLITKDRREIPVETSVTRGRWGDSDVFYGISRDITQQKRAAERLRESEEKYRALFEQAATSIVIADADTGRILEFNERAHASLGYSREEFSKLSIVDVEAAETRDDIARHIERIRAAGADTFETRHRTKTDGIRNMLTSVRFLPVGGRNLLATIWHDITEHKQTEDKLTLACEAAESANRAKSQFLANMSHEIRTPLSVIMGYTDLLMAVDSTPSEQQEHLQTIHRNAEHLLAIIADILDLSKIEADRLDCKLSDCPVRQVVDDVVDSLRPSANAKSLAIDVEYTSPLPETIRTDRNRLRQILFNLVGNAIKYTERGGVRIAVRYQPIDGPSGLMLFEVRDTGIGISEQQLAEIFEPFTQADMSLTRRFGGTGLGLTISQRLARLLGGNIDVRSGPSEGSTFTLTIDAGPVNLAKPPKRHSPRIMNEGKERAELSDSRSLSGRILLVDDDADIQAMIGAFLRRFRRIDSDVAGDGLTGCEMAIASLEQSRPYDLILMDIRMPRLDGLEATGRLRQRGWKGPIVALTAQAMAGDRRKCLEAGCDEYLSKPSAPTELLGILKEYLPCSIPQDPGVLTDV